MTPSRTPFPIKNTRMKSGTLSRAKGSTSDNHRWRRADQRVCSRNEPVAGNEVANLRWSVGSAYR